MSRHAAHSKLHLGQTRLRQLYAVRNQAHSKLHPVKPGYEIRYVLSTAIAPAPKPTNSQWSECGIIVHLALLNQWSNRDRCQFKLGYPLSPEKILFLLRLAPLGQHRGDEFILT